MLYPLSLKKDKSVLDLNQVSVMVMMIIIIIIIIFKCYFSGEHIALSIKKIKKQQQWCEHRLRKNQQIKSTVHDAN